MIVLAVFTVIGIPVAVDAYKDAKTYNLQIKIKKWSGEE